MKAAFGYFCALNKNLSLYNAFKSFCLNENDTNESEFTND